MRGEDAERDIDRRPPEEIANSLGGVVQGTTLLVGPGQYSPYPDHERVIVLSVDDRASRKPVLVWDRFLPRSAIAPLCNALRTHAREVRCGELDSMYATPWSYAWTTSPEVLRVYDRAGLLVEMQHDVVQVRRRLAHVPISLSHVVHVVGWLSSDWCQRGVSLILLGHEQLVVAESEDSMVLVDPTYDRINLMCDASWVGRLGKAMAKGLGVPYVNDNPALA